MQVPDGAISTEAADVKKAVALAAEQLGVPLSRVQHKLDISHFRSAGGGPVARTTVKIMAWALPAPEGQEEAPAPAVEEGEKKRPRRRRRSEDGPSPEVAEPEAEAPAEAQESKEVSAPAPVAAAAQTTPASEFCAVWFQTLVGHLGLVGEVVGTGTPDRVRLQVKVDQAGRLIGRRGATLGAIRQLLLLALSRRFSSSLILDVDVDGGRESERSREDRPRGERRDGDRGRERRDDRGERRDDRGERRDDRGERRDDRGERRDDRRGPRSEADRRGPPRDRDRRDDRGRDRDRDRDRGAKPPADRGPRPTEKGSGLSEEKIQLLARRAAEKAKESGKTITIKLELNSYERRLVHLEISEIGGVRSESEVRTVTGPDGRETTVKYVQVIPGK